jgi:serine beta-lactamase-like protein LACTB, mitochondrial
MSRTRLRIWLVVSLIVAVGLPAAAQSREPNTAAAKAPRNLSAAVDAATRAEMERQQAVGVAVGVIRDGKIVYLKGYGQADRERKIPVTAKTVFNWASISKTTGAVLAMQLVEAGKLDLEADVRTYVPDFPDKGKKITCRDLLCHQSGIPHYSNGVILATRRKYDSKLPFVDPMLALDKFKDSPLLFDPGEKFSYTTYGYILLSAAVQAAGKEPYADQLRKRITEPLGMKSFELDMPYDGQKQWAAGYVMLDQRGKKVDDKRRNEEADENIGQTKIVPTPEEANYWKAAGGAYKSDIGDLAKWAQALMGPKLLNDASKQRMWQAQLTSDGKPTEYGLGFRIAKRNGRLQVGHNGGQDEVRTRMVFDPESRNGVVVMCNCDFVSIDAMEKAISSAIDKIGN